jgi:hypothetical protein
VMSSKRRLSPITSRGWPRRSSWPRDHVRPPRRPSRHRARRPARRSVSLCALPFRVLRGNRRFAAAIGHNRCLLGECWLVPTPSVGLLTPRSVWGAWVFEVGRSSPRLASPCRFAKNELKLNRRQSSTVCCEDRFAADWAIPTGLEPRWAPPRCLANLVVPQSLSNHRFGCAAASLGASADGRRSPLRRRFFPVRRGYRGDRLSRPNAD